MASGQLTAATAGRSLVLEAVTKQYGAVRANDRVSLEVRGGEIHALLGENGAGKTTLMGIACGIHQPDAGHVIINGMPRRFRSRRDARAAGIGMVEQHPKLVPTLSVAANVALGVETGPFVRLAAIESRLERLSRDYRLEVNPRSRVDTLSAGQLQRAAIAIALYDDVDVLVLDEPTTMLTPDEAGHLFSVLRGLRDEGRAIVFISHKLDEVLSIADRVSVLRRGALQATLPIGECDLDGLVELMIGQRQARPQAMTRAKPREVVLQLRAVSLVRTGRSVLRDIDLELRAGELLAIAGVEGNGQRELAEVLAGLIRPTTGSITLAGHDIWTERRHRRTARTQTAFIPADGLTVALIPEMTVEENLFLRPAKRGKATYRGLIRRTARRSMAEALMARYAITGSPSTPVRELSGGNQRKVVLARELEGRPPVIIAAQPTQGLDVAATAYVHKVLRERRADGAGIVLISADLDEIFDLADRVSVLRSGRVVGTVDAATADHHQIGSLMTGVS